MTCVTREPLQHTVSMLRAGVPSGCPEALVGTEPCLLPIQKCCLSYVSPVPSSFNRSLLVLASNIGDFMSTIWKARFKVLEGLRARTGYFESNPNAAGPDSPLGRLPPLHAGRRKKLAARAV